MFDIDSEKMNEIDRRLFEKNNMKIDLPASV